MQVRTTHVLVAALAVVLAACGGSASESGGEGELEQVTVSSAPNAFLAPLYVAIDDGMFEDEGLDVEIVEVEAGTDSVAALVSGSSQVADIGFDDLVELVEEGEDSLLMFHNILNRVTLTMVMNPDIAEERGVDHDTPIEERYAALEGLRLGITSPGAPTDAYIRYYLEQAGLDPERDADIIAIGGGSSLLAALESDQIDAFHLSPPPPYIAENEGFGTVIIDGPAGDVPEFSDFLYTGFATNRAWAVDNPEAASAFSRALTTAMEQILEDTDAAGEEILDNLGGEELEITQQTLDALAPAMSEDGCFTDQGVQESLEIMHEAGITGSPGDAAEGELWTNEYNGC